MDWLLVAVVGCLLGGWAIPLGFLLGMEPLSTYVAATAGGLTGCWGFLLLGDRLRAWVAARRSQHPGGTTAPRARHWVEKVVDKHGASGLGVVGPIILGVTLTVTAGVALDLDRPTLGRWMTASIIGLYALYVLGLWVIVEIF